jgi:hypothetical protein
MAKVVIGATDPVAVDSGRVLSEASPRRTIER